MLSEAEKAKRRKEVMYAKASVELEGIYLSQELLDISEKYIQGYLNSQEYSNELLRAIDSH